MSAMDVGRRLVALCQQGENLAAIDTLYSPDIVSIEPVPMEEMPAELRGVEAVRGKNQWWLDNHEIHSHSVDGPFPHGDRFACLFEYEVTPRQGLMAGKRMGLREIAIYTVEDGKIAREEFFYVTQ